MVLRNIYAYIYANKYIYNLCIYIYLKRSCTLPLRGTGNLSMGLIHVEDLASFNYFYCLDDLMISTILNLIHSVELIRFVISMMNKVNHSP